MMISAIFDALTISFIKRMNKRGPKIEPWSIPHVTGKFSELVLLSDTYWVRYDK